MQMDILATLADLEIGDHFMDITEPAIDNDSLMALILLVAQSSENIRFTAIGTTLPLRVIPPFAPKRSENARH
jgi:hypothetical protein